MERTRHYRSPLGDILIACDEAGLTGLWFEGQKYFAAGLKTERMEISAEKDAAKTTAASKAVAAALDETVNWLDSYFAGGRPEVSVAVHLRGTEFQMEVWDILRTIPYGETVTYGWIAAEISAKRGLASMSAQAVGSAVGHNPISIIVPCHRVVGKDGRLTGYAGGIERKKALLALESK